MNGVALLVFLLATGVTAAESRPKRLLIVGQGSDGHPPTTHEFMPGARVLAGAVAAMAAPASWNASVSIPPQPGRFAAFR